MRLCDFPADHGAAYQERCGAGLHEENICLVLMPFDDAVGLATRKHKGVVGKISEPLHPNVVGVFTGFHFERLVELPSESAVQCSKPSGTVSCAVKSGRARANRQNSRAFIVWSSVIKSLVRTQTWRRRFTRAQPGTL